MRENYMVHENCSNIVHKNYRNIVYKNYRNLVRKNYHNLMRKNYRIRIMNSDRFMKRILIAAPDKGTG